MDMLLVILLSLDVFYDVVLRLRMLLPFVNCIFCTEACYMFLSNVSATRLCVLECATTELSWSVVEYAFRILQFAINVLVFVCVHTAFTELLYK